MTEAYSLWSGGRDSTVVTHRAMAQGRTDGVIYLDTSTGLPENHDWIRDVCAKFDWPFKVLDPTLSLKEFGLRYGFPKAGSHSWAMRYFKEHALGRFATICDGCPQYYSGVYADESDRRMENVDGRVTDMDRWQYVSPCHNWPDWKFDDYIQDHGLPENPHAEALGRSPDCFCLAFGSRDEVLIRLRSKGYGDHADRLLRIEHEVQEEIGTDKDYCWLGSEGLSHPELRALKADSDDYQTKLCADCAAPKRSVVVGEEVGPGGDG